MYNCWNSGNMDSSWNTIIGGNMEKLKSEIFDMLREQEILKRRIMEIEKLKQVKLKELQELENEKTV